MLKRIAGIGVLFATVFPFLVPQIPFMPFLFTYAALIFASTSVRIRPSRLTIALGAAFAVAASLLRDRIVALPPMVFVFAVAFGITYGAALLLTTTLPDSKKPRV